MRRALAPMVLPLICACFADDPTMLNPAAESCETYCSLAIVYCRDGNMLFTDPNTCPTTCAAFDATGISGDVSGNTLQCRLTYLFAADKDPLAFCHDASPESLSCQ